MVQRLVLGDVVSAPFFMGPLFAASFLLVEALRALTVVQDGLLAATRGAQNAALRRAQPVPVAQLLACSWLRVLNVNHGVAPSPRRDEKGQSYCLGTWEGKKKAFH